MSPDRDSKDADDLELLKIKHDALRLLSFGPRSSQEMRTRLKKKRYPEDLIERLISLLQRQGMIDDAKFAKLFAESRVYSRPSGKRQLEMDLKQKGLSPDIVRQTLGGLKDFDEKAMVRELALKRLRSMAGVPVEKKRNRIYGYLKRRGFGNDAIFGVLKELLRAGTADENHLTEDPIED